MTGLFDGFSTEYLSDKSTPWADEAYTHIFVEDFTGDSGRNRRLSTAEKKQRREAIILVISKRAMQENSGGSPKQPQVRFANDEILVTVDDPALLESLWRSPPVYRGKELKLTYRGLPWPNVTVWGLSGGKSASEQEVAIACRNFTGGRKDAINILASFYEVQGMEGGPVYTGDVLVFWSNYCQRKKPKFNGEPLRVISYNSDSESDED